MTQPKCRHNWGTSFCPYCAIDEKDDALKTQAATIERLTHDNGELRSCSEVQEVERYAAANSVYAKDNERLHKENTELYERAVVTAKTILELTADRTMRINQLNEYAELLNSREAKLAIAQEAVRNNCARVFDLTAERDALQEGLDGWHSRYLDCEVERDAALAASRHETDLCQQALEDLEKFAAENAALAKDTARIDWIECRAMNGCIEIARSIMKTGYEFGIRTKTESTIFVKSGTLRAAIDAAIVRAAAAIGAGK